jgi:hypothetical protein
MLATFCLRLACGLMAALLALSPSEVNPRFFRTHFLTTLGLGAAALACLVLWTTPPLLPVAALAVCLLLAFAGSISWSVEGAPAGRGLTWLTAGGLIAALSWFASAAAPPPPAAWRVADDLSSALLLGTATTAMLLGHMYLIAPGMSIRPLLRLLAALGVAVALRMAIAGAGLWFWTEEHSLSNVEDVTVLWLPLHWGLSFLGPLVLGGMAWQTARIRSTQSATGLLYVIVILCFLGELASQLLCRETGFTL